MGVLVLSHDDVIVALPPAECAETMAQVLAAHARGKAHMPLRSVMAAPGAAGFMGLMPAWRGGPEAVFALKAICVMPGNPARGLDAHQGIVTLFTGDTGVPTAILDASAITAVRTAAVSAVATRLLAREDARVLAILGAGVQGRAHLDALLGVREFESVRVYSPTAEHARALASRPTRVDVAVAASAEDAVRGADVIVTATNSREPVLAREWISPGAHVNAIGAGMLNSRELDLDTVAASAFFCDSRESLRNEAGEYHLALSQGAIRGEDHVRGELGEVLVGSAPGRRSDEELTVFRSLGLAVEDLAAAEHAVGRARELGLGVEVEL
ncbi:MAG: ornithine cyclodeaminase family protein [Solirubrobacteraceae bacterium]